MVRGGRDIKARGRRDVKERGGMVRRGSDGEGREGL